MPYEMSIRNLPFFHFTARKGRMLDHLLVCRDVLAYYRDSKVHMSYSMMKQ